MHLFCITVYVQISLFIAAEGISNLAVLDKVKIDTKPWQKGEGSRTEIPEGRAERGLALTVPQACSPWVPGQLQLLWLLEGIRDAAPSAEALLGTGTGQDGQGDRRGSPRQAPGSASLLLLFAQPGRREPQNPGLGFEQAYSI